MGKPIRNIQKITKNKNNIEISVVILSDRPPHGMRSYGTLAIHHLHLNKMLLDYQLHAILSNLKVKEIILIAGFKIDKILKRVPYTLSIIENINYNDNNTLKSISIGVNAATTKKILFIDGNIFMSHKFFSKFHPQRSQIFLYHQLLEKENIGSIVNDRNEVENSTIATLHNCWQHILYIEEKELELLKTFCNDEDKQKWYTFEATNKITDMGGKFIAHYTPHLLIYINSHDTLKKAEWYANNNC